MKLTENLVLWHFCNDAIKKKKLEQCLEMMREDKEKYDNVAGLKRIENMRAWKNLRNKKRLVELRKANSAFCLLWKIVCASTMQLTRTFFWHFCNGAKKENDIWTMPWDLEIWGKKCYENNDPPPPLHRPEHEKRISDRNCSLYLENVENSQFVTLEQSIQCFALGSVHSRSNVRLYR